MILRVKGLDDLPAHARASARREVEAWDNPTPAPGPSFRPPSPAAAAPPPPPKRRKYRNQPVEINGIRFDSKLEGARYRELLELQALNLVDRIMVQPSFRLGPRIRYRADFEVYWTDRQLTVEDCKSRGTRTAVYLLKKKLMAEHFPTVRIWEIEKVPAGAPPPLAGRGEP